LINWGNLLEEIAEIMRLFLQFSLNLDLGLRLIDWRD